MVLTAAAKKVCCSSRRKILVLSQEKLYMNNLGLLHLRNSREKVEYFSLKNCTSLLTVTKL